MVLLTLALMLIILTYKFKKKPVLKSNKKYMLKKKNFGRIFYTKYNVELILKYLEIYYCKDKYSHINWRKISKDSYLGVVDNNKEVVKIYHKIDKVVVEPIHSCKLMFRFKNECFNDGYLDKIFNVSSTMQIDFGNNHIIKRYRRNNALDVTCMLKNDNNICVINKNYNNNDINHKYIIINQKDYFITNLRTNVRILNNYINKIQKVRISNNSIGKVKENVFLMLKELYLSNNLIEFNNVLSNNLLGISINKDKLNINKNNDFLKYSFTINEKLMHVDFTGSSLKINYGGIDYYNVHSFKI